MMHKDMYQYGLGYEKWRFDAPFLKVYCILQKHQSCIMSEMIHLSIYKCPSVLVFTYLLKGLIGHLG